VILNFSFLRIFLSLSIVNCLCKSCKKLSNWLSKIKNRPIITLLQTVSTALRNTIECWTKKKPGPLNHNWTSLKLIESMAWIMTDDSSMNCACPCMCVRMSVWRNPNHHPQHIAHHFMHKFRAIQRWLLEQQQQKSRLSFSKLHIVTIYPFLISVMEI
jgi:hypothetical protein